MFGLKLKWLGCACFEMDFGGITVVNDPWITPNAKTDLTWESVDKCDYITLTHSHYDHIMDIPQLMEKFPAYLMCGELTAMPLTMWADVNPMRVYPMSPNLELDLDGVKIKALYGRHSPLPGTAQEREANRIANTSNPLLQELGRWGDLEYRNYLYTMPSGVKVLMWGNKISRPDQRNILLRERPDIAIVQVTGVNTAEEMATACKEMGCKVVIPHHVDYPGDYTRQMGNLGDALAAVAPEISFVVPQYNQWVEV